jgi:hypothetical protein
LYIDDEVDSGVRPFMDAVQRANDELRIDLRRPAEFSKDLRVAADEHPDGLILDLRLDLVPDESGNSVDYRAPSLAQEVRTRASEGTIADVPIVLWSTQVNLDKSFNRDQTGHDLFDLTYDKAFVAEAPETVARELVAVADGYKSITSICRDVEPDSAVMRALLSLGPEQPLDARVSDRFSGREKLTPAHEYARFILQDLILYPGPLLDELRLAAMLGVSIEESAGWPRLLDAVSASQYSGVFASAYFRWWRTGVDKWWAELKTGKRALRLLGARERVKLVSEATGITDLIAAKPLQPGYSEKFSTICEGTQKPLDPIDGFRVRGREPEPWQEPRIISAIAALERRGYERGLRVHPLERERYDELVEAVSNGAPR